MGLISCLIQLIFRPKYGSHMWIDYCHMWAYIWVSNGASFKSYVGLYMGLIWGLIQVICRLKYGSHMEIDSSHM